MQNGHTKAKESRRLVGLKTCRLQRNLPGANRKAASGPSLKAAEGAKRNAASGPSRRAAEGANRKAASGPSRRAAEGANRKAASGPSRRAAEGANRRAASGPSRRAAEGAKRKAASGPSRRAADGPYRLAVALATRATSRTETMAKFFIFEWFGEIFRRFWKVRWRNKVFRSQSNDFEGGNGVSASVSRFFYTKNLGRNSRRIVLEASSRRRCRKK